MDYAKGISDLNRQLEAITARLDSLENRRKPPEVDFKTIRPMPDMHPDPRLSEMMNELSAVAEEEQVSGAIAYLGVFSSAGRQSNWIRNQMKTDSLLELIESNKASKVLACIGSNDRLNLLLALLRTPRTAAQLVEECGYNTTGQVYHHLKPLIAIDLVQEDEKTRGCYVIPGHRVQGLIMLLAGISDLFDPELAQFYEIPKKATEANQ